MSNQPPWSGQQPPAHQPYPAYQQSAYRQQPAYQPFPGPSARQSYYGMVDQPKPLSIASLVCGIASVIMGWLLLPQVAAIVTGHLGLKREPSGRGLSIAGLVMGYLFLLGYGALWLLLLIGLAVFRAETYYSA